MKILIAFGSTEGHTREIVQRMKALIREKGHEVSAYDCGSRDEMPDLGKFDAFFVAGSVHQRTHQPFVSAFVKDNLSALSVKPSAFISVSLSIALEGGRSEAESYVTDFLADTGWKPTETHMAAGAIRFLEYDFFKRFTIEHIVLGGKKAMPDKSAGNPEYTDWDALSAFVSNFVDGAESK